MKAKPRFISYHLHQFLLQQTARLTPEQLALLDDADQAVIRDLDRASLEDKLWLLGKLGHRFAVVVGRRAAVQHDGSFARRAAKLLGAWRKKITLSSLQDLKHWGVFVLADTQVMKALVHLSHVVNTKTYYAIKNYDALAAAIDTGHQNSLFTAEKRDGVALTIDRFLLGALTGLEMLQRRGSGAFNIPPNAFAVLLALNINGNNTSETELNALLGLSPGGLRYHLDALEERGYIDRFQVEGVACVQLSGMGTIILNRIRDYLIKKSK